MRYVPNPAHKVQTTEAGPPRWRPNKTPCPKGMTRHERSQLLKGSIAADPASPKSRRYAVRRGDAGLEFFAAQVTQVVGGKPEYHGYPADHVPGNVLREFLKKGVISRPEYSKQIRKLG